MVPGSKGNHFPERARLLGFIVAGHIQRPAEMSPGVTHASQPSHFLPAVFPSIPNKEPASQGLGRHAQSWGSQLCSPLLQAVCLL